MTEKSKKQSTGDSKLTAEMKLEIQDAVENRLEKLPAGTYRLIDEMVESRVARYEKMYRIIGLILIGAATFVSVAFYKITSAKAQSVCAAPTSQSIS
jgi:hypothetical protein